MTGLSAAAKTGRAWPFHEARNLAKRLGGELPAKGHVLFETGYGPSGLPHIGTFGEVARTAMVRHAFAKLTGMPTRLVAFSDDMDGMRSVPDNVPEWEMLEKHLGKPLTDVPDPFGTHESFAHHNNARLRSFLDRFGFDYEFLSAAECYRRGDFDATLLEVLRRHDEIVAIVRPTLGSERGETWSPFLPVCARTGRVLQAPVTTVDADAGTIVYQVEDGSMVETSVKGGQCKLQWKADWAMRWLALGVDYEMNGKDLISSFELSARIVSALGGRAPVNMTYELFLDEHGHKISKSIGNGLTIDEWLDYGTEESLSLYMFLQPRRAKRLYFDVIPRHVDDYERYRARYADETEKEKLENPLWHIHAGHVDTARTPPLTYGMLLNLAGACNAEDAEVLWGFIRRYAPTATPEGEPVLARLAERAVRYYQDRVRPTKSYRKPSPEEASALEALAAVLEGMEPDAESIQSAIHEVGKQQGFDEQKGWFRTLYETLLGQERGPRMGSFVALYGVEETVALIRKALAGEIAAD